MDGQGQIKLKRSGEQAYKVQKYALTRKRSEARGTRLRRDSLMRMRTTVEPDVQAYQTACS
jgi:hypothetical protein